MLDILVSVSALTTVATQELLEEEAPAWDIVRMRVVEPGTEDDLIEEMPAVFVRDADAPIPFIQCGRGRYRLRIALESPDFRNLLRTWTRRSRWITGILIVDGEETYEGQFIFEPETQIVQARERKPAAQVFNAAIQGKDVTFRMRRRDYKLNMPPVDREFRVFAAVCKAISEEDDEELKRLNWVLDEAGKSTANTESTP